MKKSFVIAAAIASLALLVSCNKEEIAAPQNDQAQYGPMSITINYDDVDTKTTFTQNGSKLEHVWKAGDEISVLIKENSTNEKFVLTGGAGTKSATFTCNSSYLSTITADATVNIVYPYTDKVNTTDYYWVSDISDQGNGSIDNLGNYDIQLGYQIKVTYVDGGKNTFEAKSLSPLCWVLRLPEGLQLLSNAPATDVITNLTIGGEKIQNKRLYEKNGTSASWQNGAITLSNIALTNGCLANDVYVAVMSDNNANETISISFTLQSNGSTYTYPYTHAGKYFYAGHSYKMSQTALNTTTPLIKYVPAGVISGKFTINEDGDQVYFSQGNLYYDGSSFKFENNQYDTPDIGTWSTDHISHFYWSNSVDEALKEMYDDSVNDNFVFFTNETETTAKEGFTVNVGGAEQSGWRTLATNEWQYLFNTRTMTHEKDRYTLNITYGEKMGLVLYPDNYSGSVLSGTVETLPEGVVFLPAAGSRVNSDISIVGDSGGYWSSTAMDEDSAYDLNFDILDVIPDHDDFRFLGISVRLVTDIPAE